MKHDIIKQIAKAALQHIEGLVSEWYPNGKKHGQEWCVGSLSGEPGDSLKINLTTGVWKDFASDEKGGGDIVNLWAAKQRCTMSEAAEGVAKAIGFSVPAAKVSGKSHPKPEPKASESDGWDQVTNPPEDGDDAEAAPTKGTAYYYRTKDGRCLFCVERFVKPDGKKSFVPWTLWENCNGPTYKIEWRRKALAAPRPLYNLDKLTKKPSADVVVVEGEKCADELQAIFPELVVITWAGGANATGKTDFEPLRNRTLLFLPDNDEPGKKAMAGLVAVYGGKVIVIPDDKEKGWDCADAIAEGWGRSEFENLWANATVHRAQETVNRDVPRTANPALAASAKLISLELREPESDSLAPPVPKHYTERQDDIILPGGAQSISATARKIVKLMAAKYYGRGRELLRVKCGVNGLELDPILEKRLCSEVERIGKVVQWATEKNEAGGVIHGSYILVPAIMGAGAAGTLLPAVVEGLPKIRGVVNFPRLRADGTIQAGEYDTESGLLCAKSVEVRTLTSAEGVNALTEILRDFNPATPADASRMMAAILAPALRFGPWANERFPFPLFQIQADDSQTGKGYLIDTIAAIYGETVEKVTQGDGRGVGGFEEKVHTALAKGKPLVSFDNLRGKIESTFLESFVTAGGPVTLRIVGRTAETDSRAHILYLTDNGITMTTDLMNRVLSVSLKKQPADYKWHKWVDGGASGDLQAHIAKRRAYYLGAVYAVMRDWITAGMPSAETRHHQRQVVGALNWIVTNVFHWPDVMDGHEAMRERQTSPVLAFLLEVAKVAGVGDYSATELLEAATEADVPLPPTIAGRKDADGPKKQLGLSLKPIFKTRSRVSLGGGWSVERLIKPTNYAHGSHEVPVYRLGTE